MTELALREQIRLDADVLVDPMWQGSRITNMINQAQDWLQAKLLKQGYKVWSDGSTVSSLTASGVEGVVTQKGNLPSDIISDLPIESVFPAPALATEIELRSWQFVEIKNFNFVAFNPVTAPSTKNGIYTVDQSSIHIYPLSGSFTTIVLRYTRKVLDMVFDNDSTNSEIPNEIQWILIERVVMQIKSIVGNEQLKQAKLNEIDKELAVKYQLDALVKEEDKDMGQVQ